MKGSLSTYQKLEMSTIYNHLVDADEDLIVIGPTEHWHREQYAVLRELQHMVSRARALAKLLYDNELKG